MPVCSVITRRTALMTVLALLPAAARAQGSLLDRGKSLLGGAPATGGSKSGAALSDGEIGSGLKDALRVASQRVVAQLGRTDGYNADPAIRIPLPGPLQQIAGPLKSVGASGMLDDLQVRMNRAAEQAAPKALAIFTDAISKMSIADARGILTGPKDAATSYFRRTTSTDLTKSFRPVVDNTLSTAGAVTAFKSVQSQASTLPLAGSSVAGFNLTDFTVGKALDGLFHYLAVQEDAIRTNPAARTTDLLKKVFG
ncbi:MAG: DUF4197 domain-containing protein [Gemmatimonas sp.]